jgi:hypothetical protein
VRPAQAVICGAVIEHHLGFPPAGAVVMDLDMVGSDESFRPWGHGMLLLREYGCGYFTLEIGPGFQRLTMDDGRWSAGIHPSSFFSRILLNLTAKCAILIAIMASPGKVCAVANHGTGQPFHKEEICLHPS